MLRISGRNLDIGDALRGQIDQRVSVAIKRYFDGGYSGNVTVGKEGTGFRTDCSIHLDSGVTLASTAMAHDAYASFSEAAERIEKRLRRYKRRLKDRPAGIDSQTSAQYTVFAAPDDEDDTADLATETMPAVIAESTLMLKRASVSEAVAELDLTGAPFLVFRHGGDGRVNVVYRRSDGHIGWIDPALDPAEKRR